MTGVRLFVTGVSVEFCFWTVDAAISTIRHIRDGMGYVNIWISTYDTQSIDISSQGRESRALITFDSCVKGKKIPA